jgi:glycosyltransferase involved in cell wall biosynthesis
MELRKRVIARRAGRWLRQGDFDCFHGWSGEALDGFLEARKRGIPCLLDIPTWHRDKGRRKPFYTRSERDRGAGHWQVTRQQVLAEYALADLILVQSRAAADSFLSAGVPAGKLFLLGRGVDVNAFQPASRPPVFRLVFLGSLCRRKGVHHLLQAWRRLAPPDAELVLMGGVGEDVRDDLREFGGPDVRVTGFVANPRDWLEQASAFVLPSALEGAAKAVYEAAACALPLIATRASGDVIEDGVNGILIPPDDPEALATAIQTLHADPARAAAMGARARQRVAGHFTWDHHRTRLLHAYALAAAIRRAGAGLSS